MKRIVIIEMNIDPVEYGEPDTDQAALEIVESILNQEADPGEYTVKLVQD